MSSPIYCFDPTASDEKSKVRGVGRYLQILKENFTEWNFVGDVKKVPQNTDAIFINPFFNFLQPPLISKRIAKKQLAVIHDLIPLKYPKHFPVGLKGNFNIFLSKRALQQYDAIVTDSEASKKDIVSLLKLPDNKVKVIYPCLPNIFTSNNNMKHEPLNIPDSFCLYVGDATWNKNLVNLAKAVKEINVTCVFVGKVFEQRTSVDHPWQKEFKEFMALVQEDKRFILKGFVTDDELKYLYQSASCTILVSRDEGFGFSYLEAASYGCPSVLSDIAVLHEVSRDQGALFAKPEDPSSIANTIGEFYFRKNVQNIFGIAAKKRSEFFSAKQFKDDFANVLTFAV